MRTPRFLPLSRYFGVVARVLALLFFAIGLSYALALHHGVPFVLIAGVVSAALGFALGAAAMLLDVALRKVAHSRALGGRLLLGNERPAMFTWRFCAVGGLFTFAVQLVLLLFTNLNTPSSAFVTALMYAGAACIAGGVAPYTFWWTDAVSDRRLGVIGVALILFAFLVQLVQPLLDLLNVPIR